MARNARFTLTPDAVSLIATGKVTAALDWQTPAAPGAARAQRRDPETGMPLWVVDALDEGDPDASRASVVSVEVQSMTEPAPPKFRPLEFDGPVTVSLYVTKASQLNISYVGMLKASTRTAAAA